MERDLTGILPAVVTPMQPDYSVDYRAILTLVEHVVKPGVAGIVCTAHVGEVRKLSYDERIRVAEAYVRAVDGRTKVVAGLESEFVGEAVRMARDLKAAGVDAIMVLPPWHMAASVNSLFGASGYVDPTGEHTYRYHAELAEAVDLPLVLFNYGTGSAAGYSEAALEKLCRIPSAKAIKIASASPLYIQETARLLRAARPDLSLLVADDLTLFFNLWNDVDGALIGIAEIATEEWVRMLALVREGRVLEARRIHQRLRPLMLATHVPLAVHVVRMKIALKELGLIPHATSRPPYYASEQDVAAIRDALQASELYQGQHA